MKNINNLFKNIPFSRELVIKQLVSIIEPNRINHVAMYKVPFAVGVGRHEALPSFRALAIAEIIEFEIERKGTTVVVTDVEAFNKIKEYFNLST